MRHSSEDAGRVCPADYRIGVSAFSGRPELSCDTLFVVGGLYGNCFALDALELLIAAESGSVHVVLNGDIHWFDCLPEDFSEIERHVVSYRALAGNVELELCRSDDIGVGCGCAYPDCTSDAVVDRSNRIHAMLGSMLTQHPELKEPLEGRTCTAVVRVGNHRVAITHGDEKLVAGWECSRDSLQDAERQNELSAWMRANGVSVLATTHTCAPAAVVLDAGAVINNGAAGMPNFLAALYGLVTRVGVAPSPHALYRACVDGVFVRDAVRVDKSTRDRIDGDGVFVEAVPLRYDHDAYLRWFDSTWPAESPAALSYRERIVQGPTDEVADALLGGFEVADKEDTSGIGLRDTHITSD
jgi:hypothetical protein